MITLQTEANLSVAVPLSSREIVRVAGRIASALGLNEPCLDILVTHDGPMKELNRRFLGMEGPTNVISFPESNGTEQAGFGQLVINVDAIKRESFLYGQEPLNYLVRLMVHGILHLAGYEHGEKMDELAEALIPSAFNNETLTIT